MLGQAYPHVEIGSYRLRHIIWPQLDRQLTAHKQRRMRRRYTATQHTEIQGTATIYAAATATGTAHILYVAIYIVDSAISIKYRGNACQYVCRGKRVSAMQQPHHIAACHLKTMIEGIVNTPWRHTQHRRSIYRAESYARHDNQLDICVSLSTHRLQREIQPFVTGKGTYYEGNTTHAAWILWQTVRVAVSTMVSNAPTSPGMSATVCRGRRGESTPIAGIYTPYRRTGPEPQGERQEAAACGHADRI